LPANEEIMLQFSKANASNLSFCIEGASESDNNACEEPILIPVNISGECNYITANNLANDASLNPACQSNITADLFYQFVVPASGQVKINGENFGAAIYDGCTGNTLFCINDIIYDNISYNLTPTDTLLLR